MAKRHPILRATALGFGAVVLLGPVGFTQSSTSKGDKALGEYLSGECVACHQKSGKVVGGIPAIVGWSEDQFIAVMHAYQKGERENPIMRTMARQFKDDELAALAAYFGSLKPQK